MEHFLATWGYAALFAATFISTMGIPIGSEIAISYAGVLASGAVTAPGQDHLVLGWVIVVAILGELVGSAAGYTIGYYGGRPLVDQVGRFVLLSHQDLDRAEAWFSRRGDVAAFVGRLIPLLRSWVSFAAGLAEMRLTPFSVATVAGCSIWCATLASLGYSLGSSWHHVVQKFSYVGYLALALAILVVILAMAHRIRTLRQGSRSARGGHAPGVHDPRAHARGAHVSAPSSGAGRTPTDAPAPSSAGPRSSRIVDRDRPSSSAGG